MKKMKYSKLLLAGCVLAALVVGTTLALQTTNVASLLNRFTTADNGTSIVEPTPSPNPTTLNKEVTIKNETNQKSYVRARVTVESKDDGNSALPDGITVTYTANATLSQPGENEIVVVMGAAEDWELKASDDGFYYYQKILGTTSTDNVTSPLVEKVLVGSKVDESLPNGFDVVVYQESALALEDNWSKDAMYAAFDRLDEAPQAGE